MDCDICDGFPISPYLNKNTLLINVSNDYLLYEIYSNLASNIDRLYVISHDSIFLKITDRLLNAKNMEDIHKDICSTFQLVANINCCVILDNNELDLSNNRYLFDMLMNRNNNITLIISSLNPKFKLTDCRYFSNVIIKKENMNLGRSYFDLYFSAIISNIHQFNSYCNLISEGDYLGRIDKTIQILSPFKNSRDFEFEVKKSTIQKKNKEDEIKELTLIVSNMIEQLVNVRNRLKKLEIQ